MTIAASAIARARDIRIEDEVSRRGIRLRGSVERTGPCPVCGGHDRFSINTKKGCWNCRGCSKGGDVISLVQHLDGIEFPAAIEVLTGTREVTVRKPAPIVDRDRGARDYEARQLHWAESIWRSAKAPLPEAAIEYFAKRKLDINKVPDQGGLRFHPHCPWDDGTAPCIIGRYTTAISNEPRGIWRRPIDGRKPKSLGQTGGCVIRLWPDDTVEQGLVIGEGVETTIAAATRFKFQNTLLQPAWATGSAGNMSGFPVLPSIEALTILVDHDESGTGQRAAEACEHTWLTAGREVIRFIPNNSGQDFNNILQGLSK